MGARFITTDYVALLFFAVLYNVFGGDAQTDNPPNDCESERRIYFISLIAVSSFAGLIICLICIVGIKKLIKCLFSRKSRAGHSNDPEQPLMDSSYKHGKRIKDHPEEPVNDASNKHDKGRLDRISNYELWNLTRYARHFKEEDKLSLAIENLWSALGAGLQSCSYGSIEDPYESLRIWKKSCRVQPMNQPDQLYKACTDAGMVKITRKLRDLRQVVSDVEGVTSMELEHILWQIGTQSADNITRLLGALGIEFIVQPESTLKNIVDKSLEMLETWKEGFILINPAVMLNLILEDFEFGGDEPDFFRVPEEEKQKLPDNKVSKYAHDVTTRHCNKIFELIKSSGRGKGVLINQRPYENEDVLFDTCKMIKDWLEEQECSNYEKKRRLNCAISPTEYPVPNDHDDELFTVKTIKEKASGDESKRVEVAYELLMTDIIPFARALGVDDSKLQEYRVQSSDPSHLKMGTIGLITILVD